MKIHILSLFSLFIFQTLAKGQSAVYVDKKTYKFSYAYGSRTLQVAKDSAYNRCLRAGGESPELLSSTPYKGFGMVVVGKKEHSLEIVCSCSNNTREQAEKNARTKCASNGGTEIYIAAEWNDSSSDFLNNEGYKEIENKDYQKAIEFFKNALKIESNARSYYLLGLSYFDMGDYSAAIINYNNAIAGYKAYYKDDNQIKLSIYHLMGMAESRSGKYDGALKALTDYNKLIETMKGPGITDSSEFDLFYRDRGNIFLSLRQYDKAIADYTNALAVSRDSSSTIPDIYTNRAEAASHRMDYKNALADLQKAVQFTPNFFYGYLELGRLYKYKLKNNTLGDEQLSKALRLAESQFGQNEYYCEILALKGDMQEAVKTMLVLVQQTKENKEAYNMQLYNLACIYALAGNTPKAFEYLDQSLAGGYQNNMGMFNDSDLENIIKLPQWKTLMAKYKITVPNF